MMISAGGGENLDILLPHDRAGAVIPQPEYVILSGLSDARELPDSSSIRVRDRPLLPYAFDTRGGYASVWALRDNGQVDPFNIDGLDGIDYLGTMPMEGLTLPILSFLYQGDQPGRLGTRVGKQHMQRVVAARALGEGVLHPDHIGQPRSPYIVGYDIGRRDPGTGEAKYFKHGEVGHFAMSRIVRPPQSNWGVLAAPGSS